MNKNLHRSYGAALLALVTILPLALPAGAAPKAPARKSAATAKKTTIYTCSMHPEVVSLKPGKCPKCGMALHKKTVAAVYTCKMHPAMLSLKPGKCPKCGMALTKMK